jgi:hypothetical protein
MSGNARPMKTLLTLCAACAVTAAAAGAGTSAGRPLVRPVDRSPLVVRGANFKPDEKVAVRVVVRGRARLAPKPAAATVRGAFTVRFPSVVLGDCAAFTIIATGSRGSAARYTMHPPPCGPAP